MQHLIPRHVEEVLCNSDSLIGGGEIKELVFPERAEVNSESGRVLITDHGSFVLFNIYAISSVELDSTATPLERQEQRNKENTKALMNRALRERVDNLIKLGRKVIVAGDLNIVHRPMDTFQSKEWTCSDVAKYNKQQFRMWLSNWLEGLTEDGDRGKRVIDSFRHFYPDKENEFTRYALLLQEANFSDCKLSRCRWNPTRRRVNKGARLDYVPGCSHSSRAQLTCL